MTGVLIVENDQMTRALLEIYVKKSSVYELSASVSGKELSPKSLLGRDVQIVLIGVDALEKAPWLAQYAALNIIAMTDAPEHSYISRARALGAVSFWYQEPDASALIQVMNQTMAGGSVYPEQRTAVLGAALSTDFTEREFQVLREVVSGSTDAEIAQRLGIALRTVKGHIQNLREKTGFRNRTELAVHARDCGLIIQ